MLLNSVIFKQDEFYHLKHHFGINKKADINVENKVHPGFGG